MHAPLKSEKRDPKDVIVSDLSRALKNFPSLLRPTSYPQLIDLPLPIS